jgi:hypothetical protein
MKVQLSPAEAAARAIARERRRIRWLYGLVVLLWVIVVAAVAFLIIIYETAMRPKAEMMFRTQDELQFGAGKTDPVERERLERKLWHNTASYSIAASIEMGILTGAVGLLAFATLGTLVLLHLTRRATLRQIQAGLAEISAQLADLRQRAAGGEAPG